MNARRTDGGAAFPTTLWEERAGVQYGTPHPGMSLRDWFAGQALAGMIESHGTGEKRHEYAASDAYKFADAMLAAHKEGA